MPGVRPSIKPLSAGRSSGLSGSTDSGSFDEVAQLELHLQRQLEEDVARIFDESIYSDLEVISGKLKILTHSCILKARTHKFFHKLEEILHVNIGRTTFDEIYSFISDAYTECDIQHQENEIIKYLKENLILKVEAGQGDFKSKQEDFEVSDAYATPNCVSPEDSLQKTISSSPSTELTKEYYALVPIEGQILDKELIEQDELSSGFKSFISSEFSDDDQITQCIKPTTLSLHSSHISKINKHSIICDTSEDLDSNIFIFENDNSKIVATSQVRKHVSELNRSFSQPFRKCLSIESGYSPDSLIADEGSSSSDYLSTALSASPAGSNAPRANMNNNLTNVSDSGIDNNVMLESLNSHKDVTITDVSLTESTFHELLHDETTVGQDSSDALDRMSNVNSQYTLPGTFKPIEMSGRRSSKDEKQRQNEEIVILESSSLSSETGSWESVFPPKMPEKDLCEKFLNIERQNCIEPAFKVRVAEKNNEIMISLCTDAPNSSNMSTCYNNAAQSSNKSTSCFIDASSLVDEEERQPEEVKSLISHHDIAFRSSSRPVPCDCKLKDVMSPTDISESNENDDSLEQPDPDSFQKDLSPTIFEMTLAVDDSIEEMSACEDNIEPDQNVTKPLKTSASKLAKCSLPPTVLMTSTPHNSIISLNASNFKTYDSESSDNEGASYKRSSTSSINMMQQIAEKPIPPRTHVIQQDILFEDFNKKFNESSPIISGGASIEDHLPKLSHSGSPMIRRKIENYPIVSGAYIVSDDKKPEKTVKAQSTAASWVVDMSKCSNINDSAKHWNNRPGDKACDNLKASSKSTSDSGSYKSRSSVDSDSSEKSTHKFYIDLASLPDALAQEKSSACESNEKKNIFSMFIDLGENTSTIKEMPARLSSSLNTKKTKVETKHVAPKVDKSTKKSLSAEIRQNDTFEKLESLCNSTQMTVSEIVQQTLVKKNVKQQKDSTEVQEYDRTFPRENIAPTIKEEPDADQTGDIFVRLSDLDRAPSQKDSMLESTPKTECAERMTRSIPDNNWGETSTSSKSIDIISSFHSENALSLNRLFPHLKNDISRSMPGSLSGATRSPFRLAVSSSAGDREELVSDVSEMSSVQSSMCRSVVEHSTTEDTSHTSSLLINCQSRLGQDLLRMFMEEIAPDVVVEVSGRRIKAHKCILSSRCQYFAGILSGGWVESAGNVISLPPFSFSVVHFALCHIYSGISTIPDSISIVELATIADMLGLEGLKEAIMFTLKAKYCHHFHEPCQVCTAGVLECFPLCSVYGLDDLYRRCLRWITRHFRKVWPTKAFATLPTELLDKCYQELLLNLTAENLADTVYDCGCTVSSLHRCRWAEVIARLCRRLLSAAAQFAGARLGGVLRAGAWQRGAGGAGGAALDECLARAVHSAPPEQLCRAILLLQATSKPDLIESAPHSDRVASLRRRCEEALVRAAPHALTASSYKELPQDIRRRVRDAARRHPDPPPPNPPRRPTKSSPPLIERVRSSFVPYSQRPPQLTLDRPKPAPANPPRVRTTKAQEERAKFNMTKSQEKVNGKPRALENAKPRYLEKNVRGNVGPSVRRGGRLVSSSESSRTSSPALRPRPRPRTAEPVPEPPATANNNKYATYTKSPRRDTLPPVNGSQQPKPQTTTSQNGKVRTTKIPVYLNQTVPGARRAPPVVTVKEPRIPRHRGSLMMATKSSSAKVVSKVKEPVATAAKASKTRPDIPIMQRSGTFLKDEPTFGDITTNIHIDE